MKKYYFFILILLLTSVAKQAQAAGKDVSSQTQTSDINLLPKEFEEKFISTLVSREQEIQHHFIPLLRNMLLKKRDGKNQMAKAIVKRSEKDI